MVLLGPNILGAVLSITAALFYAVSILLIRKISITDNPMNGVLAASLIGLAIFLPVSLALYFPFGGLSLQSMGAFALSGALGFILARTCYFKGTEKIGATWTAPIKNASMIVSSIIGIAFLAETVTAGHLVGITMISVGVITLGREISSNGSKSEFTTDSSLDILLPIGAMMFFGLADPLVKVGLSGGTPILVGLMTMHLSSSVLVTGFFLRTKKSLLHPFKSDMKLYYLGTGLTLSIGTLIMFLALQIAPVVIVIPLKSASPFFVLIISYVFMRDLERITKILVLGATSIVLGAALIGIFM